MQGPSPSMEDECSAEPELSKPRCAAPEREGVAFFLLPSVGTWLQERRPGGSATVVAAVAAAPAAVAAALAPKAAALAAEPAKPAASACLPAAGGKALWEDAGLPAPVQRRPRPLFCTKPSVGTWLQPRFDEDSTWATVFVASVLAAPEEPAWEADFDAFVAEPECAKGDAPVAEATVAPALERMSSAPSRTPSSGLVLLMPPPPPTSRCSVQTVVKVAEPIVIEGLEEEKKVKPKEEKVVKPPKRSLSTTEELIGTNRAPDDDEEGLLGDDAVGPAEGAFRHRPPGDGVDSASESDVGEQRVAGYAARKPPSPEAARQPSAMVSPGKQQSPPPPEEEPPAKWEALAADAPHISSTSEPRPPHSFSSPVAAKNLQADISEASKPLKDGTPVAPQASKQAPFPGASATTVPAKAPPPSAPSGVKPAAWTDVDSQVAKRLDNFFGDRNTWERVSTECQSGGNSRPSAEASPARASDRFRVRVPAPHPGLQYRRSKQLGDRYQRYVENNSTVTGQVEDDGAWLRLSHNVFLPMRIDGNQVLEPLPRSPDPARPAASAAASAGNSSEQLSWIWGWCTGCRDGAIMVDADILVRGDAPRTAAPPSDLPVSYTSR